MNIERRYRIECGEIDQIVLVGCGGTGSFLALHLARLAYHVREQHGRDIHLAFVDPDVVEDRNIGRQNFCPAEIGQHKAWTLMQRFNAAFGLDIKAYPERFERDVLNHRVRLVIGCVDNAAARRDIHNVAQRSKAQQLWWLDCGNHEHSGQVLLGNRADIVEPEISPMGFCSGLPLPSVQHPELLESEPVSEIGESCADLLLSDVQGLMVNQAVATYAAQYVYRLTLTRDLDVYATYVDLITGGARSLPVR